MRYRYVLAVGLAALCGFVFASFATYDFAQHLDREVHAIHCSFVPGLGAADATGSSGCQVTMMSPYSSVLRTAMWGGLPISLPAMGTFAFLLFWTLQIGLSKKQHDPKVTGFLALAFGLPAVMSVIMAVISFVTLGAACKLCIGIYASSAIGLLSAVLMWREAVAEDADYGAHYDHDGTHEHEPVYDDDEATPPLWLVFALGVAFVAGPTLAYVVAAPNHHDEVASCGALDWPDDTYKVMVPLGGGAKGVSAVELLDPLCPSCRAFEERYGASGLADRFARRALLFPLDNTCNWMVGSAVHPGACAVSEAVLCAGDQAPAVIGWAFAHQDEIKDAAAKDAKAAAAMASAAFPKLRNCIGSASVRTRLNKSLRWAVKNQVKVLTPQFYVEGVKLCEQDIDLGLDYALATMLDMKAKGTLPVPAAKPEAPRFKGSQTVATARGGSDDDAEDAELGAVPEPALAAPHPPPEPEDAPAPQAPENGATP